MWLYLAKKTRAVELHVSQYLITVTLTPPRRMTIPEVAVPTKIRNISKNKSSRRIAKSCNSCYSFPWIFTEDIINAHTYLYTYCCLDVCSAVITYRLASCNEKLTTRFFSSGNQPTLLIFFVLNCNLIYITYSESSYVNFRRTGWKRWIKLLHYEQLLSI